MGLTRLGVHAILNTPESRRWAARAPIVKGVGNRAVLEAAHPDAIRVYRWPWSPLDQDAILDARDADRVVFALLNGLGGYRHPNLYVEVLNEVGTGRRTQYLALLAAVVPRLHAAGLKVAGPSWATGDWERADWDAFRQVRWCGLDAGALHAYWGNQGLSPWHALRYRTYWKPGAGDPPVLLVTEAGRDAVEQGRGGWRADGLTDEQYLAELAAYDAALAADGAYGVVFSAGPTPDWSNFDVDPLCDRLAAMSAFQPSVSPHPAEKPQEQPVILLGLDCSNNNGHVDLAKAKAAGVCDFVVVKASEDLVGSPDFYDAYAAENRAQARALGVPIGFYHFVRPSRSSPAESVAALEEAMRHLGGLEAGDWLALDCEDEDFTGDLAVWFAETLALCERVFGFKPWKYSADWYTSTRALENEAFAPYPTWWASYQPSLPAPQVGWGPIRMWQYDVTQPGVVPGVAGRCDVNRFFGTVDDLRALGSPLGWVPMGLWSPPVHVEQLAPVEPAAPVVDPNVVGALATAWQATLDLAASGNEAAAIVIQKHLAEAKVDLKLQEKAA